MAVSTLSNATPQPPAAVLNLPNVLTLGRLVLAIVLFVLLSFQWLATSFVVFVIAASTDWLDGYVARRRGQTTTLGRILDPFVDKVVVIGAFVFLLPDPDSRLAPWMVTVIIARELLVTGLRSYLEGESVAFGADWMGKLKMILQCVAIGCILFLLGVINGSTYLWNEWQPLLLVWGERITMVAVWLAVGVTALSGVAYTWRAVELIRKHKLS